MIREGRYLPGVTPAGGKITIRELLQHRSGLANYTDCPSWMGQAEQSPSIGQLDALRFAASPPLPFVPGSQWPPIPAPTLGPSGS
jgi:D-alanyl-D-alanine carboxypeptidase